MYDPEKLKGKLPMSAFDPAAFEAQTTNEESSTTLIPIPPGEYIATLEGYKWRPWTDKKTQEEKLAFDVTWAILDDNKAIETQISRPPKFVQSYFVDLDAGNRFDFSKGKNVWLGKIREALDQNVPGQTWGFPMLKGQVAKIVVIQDPSKETDDIFNRVKSIGKAF